MTEETEIKRGTTVYDDYGVIAYYVGMVGLDHIVHPIYEGMEYDDEGYSRNEITKGPAVFWRRVHLTPPVEKVTAELKTVVEALTERKAELASIKAEILRAQNEKRQALREVDEGNKLIETEAKKITALRRVIDFSEGRITHVVFNDYYGIYIKTIAELEKESESDDFYRKKIKGLPLINLYGKSNGDMSWRIFEYHDGSGSSKTFRPASSLEEAEQVAKAWAEEVVRPKFDKFLSSAEKPHIHNEYSTALKWGVVIPAEIVEHVLAQDAKNRREQAGKLLAGIQRDIAKLNEYGAGAALTHGQFDYAPEALPPTAPKAASK